MPVKRQDAHRALELLEEYHNRLHLPEDKALQQAIERVIKIFKSKLFQALLDIQEFYEVTLLDENKSTEQKTIESMKVAERWSNSPGITAPPPSHQPGAGKPKVHKSKRTESPEPAVPINAHPVAASNGDPNLVEEIVLDRGNSGFGFSIAGGTDTPHFTQDDVAIYVTRVVPDGAADLDRRLRVNDTVLKVNGVDVTSVTHDAAVSTLMMAGRQLRLLVRHNPHIPDPDSEQPLVAPAVPQSHPQQHHQPPFQVILTKNNNSGLGFSIAGGIGNEHLEGDQGIFITRIFEGGPTAMDGRIQLGDRLIAVNDISLQSVTHEQAVATLKATGIEVMLTIAKATPAELAAMAADDPDFVSDSPTQGRSGKKDKKSDKKMVRQPEHVESYPPQDAYPQPMDADDSVFQPTAEPVEHEKKKKGLGSLFGKKKK